MFYQVAISALHLLLSGFLSAFRGRDSSRAGLLRPTSGFLPLILFCTIGYISPLCYKLEFGKVTEIIRLLYSPIGYACFSASLATFPYLIFSLFGDSSE